MFEYLSPGLSIIDLITSFLAVNGFDCRMPHRMIYRCNVDIRTRDSPVQIELSTFRQTDALRLVENLQYIPYFPPSGGNFLLYPNL